MSKTVAARPNGTAVMPNNASAQASSLYGPNGARKYLNLSERAAFLAQLGTLTNERRLFVLMLLWTGARVSEVLELTAGSFQPERGVVAIRTLKRRGHVVREIPIPPDLMEALDRQFWLRRRQGELQEAKHSLWRFKRETAWRFIRRAMNLAGIHGVHACPRGLRHAFGVGTLAAGIPLNIVQRLLGHSSIKTTTIYTQAAGPEEHAFAARFWNYRG